MLNFLGIGPTYECIEAELHGGFDPNTLMPQKNRVANEEDEDEIEALRELGEKEYIRRRNLAQYEILQRDIDDWLKQGSNSEDVKMLLRLHNEWDKAFLKCFADWGIVLTPNFGREETEKQGRSLAGDSEAEFRLQGENWILRFDGKSVFMKDRAGMDFIAYLLRHPRQAFSCTMLLTLTKGATPPAKAYYSKMNDEELKEEGLHAAGAKAHELIDQEAMASIKTRLKECQEELEEAVNNNDIASETHYREEIRKLEDYLSASINLSGNPRKSPDATEKTRKNVTIAITRSLNAIQKQHDSLGRHLRNSIRTGAYLIYSPEQLVDWQF